MLQSHDVIVIGGGAAGLFSAIHASRRGRRVIVVEHAEKVGKKILISGGGRCNFTNREVSARNFLSENPHFAKSALARYTPAEFIALVERHGIAYHEKTLGQLFCDGSSRQIVDMLVHECGPAQIVTGCKIHSVEKNDDTFRVSTSRGELSAASLIVASGGLSIPKMGATGFGYEIAERFGLALVPPAPALVPFVHAPAEREAFGDLSGVAFPARVSHAQQRFLEAVLFTHVGLSGPAILQISSYWDGVGSILIDCFPHGRLGDTLRACKAERPREVLRTALCEALPRRFAERLVDRLVARRPDIAERTLHEIKDSELQALGDAHNAWRYTPAGTAGYDKAEVTRGGVSTFALSGKTLEALSVRGLYFVGEVVDVTGWLGGYNFQWAWASGHAAGMAA